MLHGMEQPAQSHPSPVSSSFAGLLATLTAPPSAGADAAPLWKESELGEDVATLSYEQALRAHARYRPADAGDWAALANEGKVAGTQARAEKLAAGESSGSQGCDGDLRKASVTVRLSRAELERLRRRAGEAGLTISAYLRSCTFEAEALRAQVKDALAELRKAGTEGPSHPSGKTAVDPGRDRAAPPGYREERQHGNARGRLRRFFGLICRLRIA